MPIAQSADSVIIKDGKFVEANNYTKNDHRVVTVNSKDRHKTKYSYKGHGIISICLLVTIISGAFVLHGRSTAPTIKVEPNVPSEGLKLLVNQTVPGALHDSQERFDAPRCHKDTRIAVLQEIKEWANQPLDSCLQIHTGTLIGPVSVPTPLSPPILWLHGSAGTGKSAIAQTLSEVWRKEGRLAATFFFSRSDASRNRITPVIATIAYQLTTIIPGLRNTIGEEIRTDPWIFSKSMEVQVAALIERPFHRLPYHQSTFTDAKIIVIDGLDEIVKPQEQKELLRVLGLMIIRQTIPLRLVVTSRPEPAILSVFERPSFFGSTQHFDLNERQDVDHDIEVFLRARFASIKQDHPWLNKPSWPSDNVISTLVEHAAGMFIYASVAMDYLDDDEGKPEELLKVVMGLRSRSGDQYHPFAALDELYMQILSSLTNSTLEFAKDILAHVLSIQECPTYLTVLSCSNGGCNSARTPLQYFQPLHKLFFMNTSELDWHIKRLHSVIKIDKHYRPQTNHKSFLDFITEPSRAREFHLERGHIHARASLLLLKSLLFRSPRRVERGYEQTRIYTYRIDLTCSLDSAGPWEELVEGVWAVVQPEDELYHEYARSIRPDKVCRSRKDVLADGKYHWYKRDSAMFRYLHRWNDHSERPLLQRIETRYRLWNWEMERPWLGRFLNWLGIRN